MHESAHFNGVTPLDFCSMISLNFIKYFDCSFNFKTYSYSEGVVLVA